MKTIQLSFLTLITTMLVALFGFTFLVQAQEDELSPQERYQKLLEQKKQKASEFENNQQNRKDNYQLKKAEAQKNIADKKADARAKAEQKREEFQQLSEEKKQKAREQMEGRKEEARAKMEERKEQLRERMEERKAALQERIQKRVQNLAANVSNRMEAAIARIRQIIARFQERMDILAEKGVDTSSAQAALNTASEHLDLAEATLADIDIIVAEVVASENPREAWKTGRETYRQAKNHIKAAHQALREALPALKEAVRQAKLDRGVSSAVSNTGTQEENETEPAEGGDASTE